MKFVFGILMIVTGLIGLACTLCGAVFLPANGIGLIGIIPGLLLLWAAKAFYKAMVNDGIPVPQSARQSAAPGASSVIEDLSAVDPALLGKCPNCDATLRLTARQCPRCAAQFGPESAWKPIGRS